MPESNDIIVIGKPNTITLGNQSEPSPGPSSDGGGLQFAQRSIAQANANVNIEPEASDKEIVVIAQKIKSELIGLYQKGVSIPFLNGNHNLPCIGNVTGKEINSIINNLNFNITTQNFGEGRAGSNNIGTNGKKVPVSINATALKGYNALSGGISYLAAHEIAHAITSMQAYNKQQWDAYVAGSGAGLSYEQQVAQYPSSDQFKANEARANTVGRALLTLLNRPASGFVPTNGYQTC